MTQGEVNPQNNGPPVESAILVASNAIDVLSAERLSALLADLRQVAATHLGTESVSASVVIDLTPRYETQSIAANDHRVDPVSSGDGYFRALVHGLRAMRERRGLSQAALARVMGISPGRVSEIENSLGGEPRLSTLSRLVGPMGYSCRMFLRANSQASDGPNEP